MKTSSTYDVADSGPSDRQNRWADLLPPLLQFVKYRSGNSFMHISLHSPTDSLALIVPLLRKGPPELDNSLYQCTCHYTPLMTSWSGRSFRVVMACCGQSKARNFDVPPADGSLLVAAEMNTMTDFSQPDGTRWHAQFCLPEYSIPSPIVAYLEARSSLFLAPLGKQPVRARKWP